MTSERRLLVGVADIKSIAYECKKCGARLSFSPDNPMQPNNQCFQCHHPWVVGENSSEVSLPREYMLQSPFIRLLDVVQHLRKPDVSKTLGFKLVFELDEDQK